MAIRTPVSVMVLGWLWVCVSSTHADGLESLKPLADGHFAYMCQLDNRENLLLFWIRNYKLYCKTSDDHGRTWSAEERLTPEGAAHWEPTALQDSSSRLWLLWTSNRYSTDSGYDLEYMTSIDDGRTWTTHGTIVTPDFTSQRGSLVETDGRILAFWGFGRWVTTADTGGTWSEVTEVVDNALMNQMLYKAHDGQFWIAGWTGTDISAKTSNDALTWSAPIKITDSSSAKSPGVAPEIGQDGYGNLVVVWNSQHYEANNEDVWYSVSLDNGLTWDPPHRLMHDSGQDREPSLALIDGSLWVIWTSNRTGDERVYAFELGPNPWDFNADGWVDGADYALFAQQWRQDCEPQGPCTRADFDKSGRVDVADLGIFAEHWLKATPWTLPEPWPLP